MVLIQLSKDVICLVQVLKEQFVPQFLNFPRFFCIALNAIMELSSA